MQSVLCSQRFTHLFRWLFFLNIEMNLTAAIDRDYSSYVTAKSVARGRSLSWSGEEPQSYFERLFLCVGMLSLWVAKQREPKGSPVLHRSSNLCFGCPPVSKLAGDSKSLMERIVSTKSTSTFATPKARSRRKSPRINHKVLASIVFINPELRKQQALKDWGAALIAYINTLSNDEQTIVRKCMTFICAEPSKRDYLHGLCPVIQFPANSVNRTEISG